ncbi:MAG TPA: class I lanthipeptide [Thermoanaerobaculia bacterium]|nr:class I lanthipeptide [Thermoanaerobaculia bacterium]
MKKRTKKLVLGKETLRSLEAMAIENVAGGSVYLCFPTYYNSDCRYCAPEPNKSLEVC